MSPAEFITVPLIAVSGTTAKPADATVPCCSFRICGPDGRGLYLSGSSPDFARCRSTGHLVMKTDDFIQQQEYDLVASAATMPEAAVGQTEAN